MSETEYKQLIERMLEHDATSPMISSETGIKAARKVGKLAQQEEIEWAVAGGLAMHFYGTTGVVVGNSSGRSDLFIARKSCHFSSSARSDLWQMPLLTELRERSKLSTINRPLLPELP